MRNNYFLIVFFLISINFYAQNFKPVDILNNSTNFEKQKTIIDSFDQNLKSMNYTQKVNSYYGIIQAKENLVKEIYNFNENQNDIEKFKKQFASQELKKESENSIIKTLEIKKLVLMKNHKFKFVNELFSNSINYKFKVNNNSYL